MSRRILDTLTRLFEAVSVAFLAILSLSVIAQIIMRNFFNSGSIIIEELARYSLVSLVFLMLPVLAFRKQHIIVDFVLVRLPEKARRVFDIAINAIFCASMIFLVIAIARIMKMNWNVKTAAIRMPNYIFYLPVVLGVVVTAAETLIRAISIMAGKEASK